MASKKPNTDAQNKVSERRLRPIYDWLDNYNNKKALQEADKVLKKQPDFACCKVLKSLALIRMQRQEEAFPILESVLAENITDDSTLQAMNMAYRELGMPEKVCVMYEKAVKLEPSSEEFLSQLFIAYVRMSEYKKQQTTAMSLYKTKPSPPYYFWAVMSIVLQAKTNGDEKVASTVILPLAERMIAKMYKEDKMRQEQETRLYLMVLEFQHKYKEALEILEGPLGKAMEETSSFLDFVPTAKLGYLQKTEQWARVNILAKDMLQKNPDQWNVYLDYITSIFRMVDDKNNDWPETADSNVVDAVNFITFQKENNPKCRGPFLAQIELHSRLIARRDQEAKPEEMTDLLVGYFKKFGEKPCCTSDLKLYVTTLETAEADRFLKESFQLIDLDASGLVAKTVPDVYRHICWHAMNRLLGRHHPPVASLEDRCLIVNKLIHSYQSSRDLVKNYIATDMKPNDAYLLMAGYILWELWAETSADKYFWKAVVHLYEGVQLSPASYTLRILLIKFLNQIGAVTVAGRFFAGLDLKHVQHDSLGHIMSKNVLTAGNFGLAMDIFVNHLKFFNNSYKEIIDYVISAYRCGSFEKILEFINLRDRLANSLHFNSLTVERSLLNLMHNMVCHSQTATILDMEATEVDKEKINWSGLTDNRDFTVLPSWDPSDRSVTDDLVSESFIQEQKFLKFRLTTLRAITAAVYLTEDICPDKRSSSTVHENGESNATSAEERRAKLYVPVLQELADSLESLIKSVRDSSDNYKAIAGPVQGPDRSRLTLYVEGQHPDLVVFLIKAVMAAQSLVTKSDQDKEKSLNNLKTSLNDANLLFSKMADGLNKGCDDMPLRHRESHFESIITVLESGSVAAAMCGACQKLVAPSAGTSCGGTSNKKTKKKGGGAKQQQQNNDSHGSGVNKDALEVFAKTIDGFVSSLKNLREHLNSFQKVVLDNDQVAGLQVKFSELELSLTRPPDIPETPKDISDSLNSSQKEIRRLMERNYKETMEQITIVLNNKMEYFMKLRPVIS